MRDLNPAIRARVPPDYASIEQGCGCDISPDSKELAFTENFDPVPAISTHADIFTLDLTDPSSKPVKVIDVGRRQFQSCVLAGWKVAGLAIQARNGYESDKFRLALYDREKKTVTDLLPKFDNWVDEIAWESPDWIAFTSPHAGEEDVYSANATSGNLELLAFGGSFSDLHFVTRSQKPGTIDLAPHSLVAASMKVDRPTEVVSVIMSDGISTCSDCADHTPTNANADLSSPITHLNDALLAQLDLPKMESFWFTVADGTKLQGFLIRPPGFDAAKKYPVKFLIHGGPQGRGATTGATAGTQSSSPPTATSSS
jgi:dipeptidyl aminopeptidase/acylaminoacyl peptidase